MNNYQLKCEGKLLKAIIKYYKFYFFIFFFFFQPSIKAQILFSILLSDSADSKPVGLIEYNNAYYLFSNETNGNDFYTRIRIMDTLGNIVKDKCVKIENKAIATVPSYVSDSGIYLVGFSRDYGSYYEKCLFIKLNSNLEPIIFSESNDGVGFTYNMLTLEYGHSIFYCIDALNEYGIDRNIYMYKWDLSGNLIKSISFGSPEYSEYLFWMFKNYENDSIFLLAGGFYYSYPSSLKLVKIDTLLSSSLISEFPLGDFIYYNNLEYLTSNRLIYSGKYLAAPYNPRNDEMGVAILDRNFIEVRRILLGAPDTVDYPGYYHNFSSIDNRNFYCTFTKNQSFQSVFEPQLSWISICAIDTSLTLKWMKFYGGDANYGSWNVLSTHDGGCLVAATKYEWWNYSYQRDIVLIKIDSTGLITSNKYPFELHLNIHDAIVYPNPGREKLVIENGPQIAGARFVLYDMAGKPVVEALLNKTSTSLSTTQLSPGLYLWNIIYKGKVIESGKWVKE